MALPSAYLIATRSLEPLLAAIQSAKAPAKFTQRFLEELDFKSTNDRLFINVFKALGLLTQDGTPTPRYYELMDQRRTGRVLGKALEEAYADLFQIRRDAQNMSRQELKGAIKTLTQGQYSDHVVDRMAATFLELARVAHLDPRPGDPPPEPTANEGEQAVQDRGADDDGRERSHEPLLEPTSFSAVKLGGFVYNIELHLPESRDPAVYEALFRSLKAHLLS